MGDILIGWLAPSGDFHKCGFMEHTGKAEELAKYYYNQDVYYQPEEYLYEKGFIKFTRDDAFLNCANGYKTVSDKQAVFINDHELTMGQRCGINHIFGYAEIFGATCGDEELQPYIVPRVIHTMDEYAEPTKFIKITSKVPVSPEFRPVVGEIYPVIKEGGKYAHLYFILVNGEEVGIYPERECEIVDCIDYK